MRIAILHNQDHALLEDDPGREAREDVVRVAAAMRDALSAKTKHSVTLVPVEQDLLGLHEAFGDQRPDVVLNLCESLAADARGEMLVPAMLELLQVPYTGSSALSLALALHKNKAKEILRARGVPTPEFLVVEHVEQLTDVDLSFPLIVKPSREDASVGIDFDSVVSTRQGLGRAVARVLRTFRQPALVERFIEGREVYVPLLGNAPRRSLPLSEIRFGNAFAGKPNVVSYKAKWDTSSAECIESPSELANLPKDVAARCVDVALAAFEALECRDYGRVDLRVDASGQPWVIDINPNCDLHPQAGFARAAEAAGLSYADLALHLVDLAWERRHGNQAPRLSRPDAARRAAEPHRDLHAGRGVVRARSHRRRAHAQQS
ncbi:MAG: D-alanine--D-alanine ligase family protein [Myxococcota bacterium]